MYLNPLDSNLGSQIYCVHATFNIIIQCIIYYSMLLSDVKCFLEFFCEYIIISCFIMQCDIIISHYILHVYRFIFVQSDIIQQTH